MTCSTMNSYGNTPGSFSLDGVRRSGRSQECSTTALMVDGSVIITDRILMKMHISFLQPESMLVWIYV
jgi:hypothetical protein